LRVAVSGRRTVLIGGASAFVLGGLLARVAGAQTVTQSLAQATNQPGVPATAAAPAPAPTVVTWESEMKRILADGQVSEGKLALDIPEMAENGNTVPFSVTVESPMTAESYVRSLHILTTANPQPLVAAYRFTPDNGVAHVASRMRLIATQDVIIIAETQQNAFLVARRTVKVAIGCCGN
jgi:sulfur-oxidizing protein SoxY